MSLFLICNALLKVGKKKIFDELDSNHEIHKFEPHELFGESDYIYLEKYGVPPISNSH